MLEWEDEGIKEHASELLAKINAEVAESEDGDDDEEEDEEWESGSDDDDEEMKDS